MGNLNILLEMVRKASETGADYIKMQKKQVKTFYSKDKLGKEYSSPYGKTYYDYRKIFEFNKRDFDVFDQECRKYNMKWFATPQDIPSLKFLMEYDLDMYKLASCNSNNETFLTQCAELIPVDKAVVISVAGRTLAEIERVVYIFQNHKMIINHCVAEYPCQDKNLRLGNIEVLKKTFGSDRVTIGYSGHEQGILQTYGAIKNGAECIERHFCLSRQSFVHHIECSLEPNEYKEMVQTVRSNSIPNNVKELIGEACFGTHFGMTEMEESFLIKNTYSSEYTGPGSSIGPPSQ